MLRAKDIQAIRDSLRIDLGGVGFTTGGEEISAEPSMPPKPINISFSVDMDKERYEEFAAALGLYDESIRLMRDINGIIHAYAEKTAETIGNPIGFYRKLCHNGNCAIAFIAMIKKRKRIFGI